MPIDCRLENDYTWAQLTNNSDLEDNVKSTAKNLFWFFLFVIQKCGIMK